jgi:hypothetical protein
MADEDWTEHVRRRTEGLPFVYFRELVLDIWGLRGFEVAHVYEGEGADFVAVRGDRRSPEREVVAVLKEPTAEDARGLAEAVEAVGDAVPVAVARRFPHEASEETERLGVETVDSSRIAGLIGAGGYYWTFYRWIALSEAKEPEVVASGETRLRYGDRDGKALVGRSAADRVGLEDGDVVRVGGEATCTAERGGVLETDRDYVSVDDGYEDAIGEEGQEVTLEVLDSQEARRAYVLSEPSMDEELASEVWRGYAPYPGMELTQPYRDGELRTMALEVLPQDYSYVTEETDIVVEGYAGARRVFD